MKILSRIVGNRVLVAGALCLLGAAQKMSAHTVQAGYGTTPSGFVRVYLKHWHGALSPSQLTGAVDSIKVTVTSASGSNTFNVNPAGTVNNTTIANLPGLTGPLTVLSTGPSATSYDDWAYWDFAPGSCNQPISITIQQGNSFYFDEEAANIFPVTIQAQTFTDRGAPVITAPDMTVAGGCNGTNVTFNVNVTDDCDTTPTVTFSRASGSFFPIGTTPVTVTATDDTGKVSTKTFNVTVFVNDTTPPTFTSVPNAITVNAAAGQCGATVTYSAAATDNCSTATISSTRASGSLFPVGTTTVTLTATDGSGNQATRSFTVTVVDTQAPTISVPADLVLNAAPGVCTAIANYTATASDNCAGVVVSYSHAPGSVFGLGETIVTATATDAAGLTASRTFRVTVRDVQAPVIATAAANASVFCGNNPLAALNTWLSNRGGAVATDNCGAATLVWTNNFSALSDGPGNTGSATVTFTVTDAGGNVASTTATFSVIDNKAPSIHTPAAALTVECGPGASAAISAWLASNGGAVASDACGSVSWSHNYAAPTGGCNGSGSVTVTFVAVDESGNASSTAATVTVRDTVAPAVTAATSQTVQSDGAGNVAALSAWLAANGGATATDACGAVTWSNNFGALSDLCGATGSATVTFTATDACGNASTATATFTIVDTTPPTVVAAANRTVQCDGAGNVAALNAWLAANGGATATDAGGPVTWSHNFTALSDGPGATGSAAVTFTATDACGNTASTTATFSIVDTTPPTIVNAAGNKVVETDGAGNTAALATWLATNGGATATDICGNVRWSHNFTALSDGCGATGTATVTFVATDESGNVSTSVATFTIVDTTKPVLAADVRNISPNQPPVTFTITSSDVGGASTPTITNVTAHRVNGAGKIIPLTEPYKHSVSGNKVTITTSGGVGTIWTIYGSATDECGNTGTATYIVNVVNPTQTR